MSALCPHNVRTMSAQHLPRETYILLEMLCDIVRTYISRDICPNNVRTISFFGFQLRCIVRLVSAILRCIYYNWNICRYFFLLSCQFAFLFLSSYYAWSRSVVRPLLFTPVRFITVTYRSTGHLFKTWHPAQCLLRSPQPRPHRTTSRLSTFSHPLAPPPPQALSSK